MRAFFGVVMVLVAEHRAFQALIREGKATSPMKYNALKANAATETVEDLDRNGPRAASQLLAAAGIGIAARDVRKESIQAPAEAKKSRERAMERL